MKRVLKNNGLSLVLFGAFLLTLFLGQNIAGLREYNADQREHDGKTVNYAQYLTTAHFGEATFENWESEFLQMSAFILLTVWLRQKGSAESKPVDESVDVDEDPAKHRNDPDVPWPVRRGGIALALYKRSLSIAFGALFLLSMVGHAFTGAREFSNEELAHGGAAVSTWSFVRSAPFWFQSFQNWQSEFLAVGSIVVLSIFLRHQGSSESKPVHMANGETPN